MNSGYLSTQSGKKFSGSMFGDELALNAGAGCRLTRLYCGQNWLGTEMPERR
jgi:hypothetical protein